MLEQLAECRSKKNSGRPPQGAAAVGRSGCVGPLPPLAGWVVVAAETVRSGIGTAGSVT